MAARGRGCLGNWGVLEDLPSPPLPSFLLSFFLLSTSLFFSPLFISPLLFSSLPIPSVTPPHSTAPLSSVPPCSTTAGLHSITETVLEWKYHDVISVTIFPAPSVISASLVASSSAALHPIPSRGRCPPLGASQIHTLFAILIGAALLVFC